MRYFIICIVTVLLVSSELHSIPESEGGSVKKLVAEDKSDTSPSLNPDNSEQDSVFLKKPAAGIENDGNKGDIGDTEGSYSTSNFVRSFVILIIFLLIVFFLFKWLQRKKLLTAQTIQIRDNIINVLKSVNIQGNLSIQLVEIASRIYILGVGDGNVSLITEIDDPAEIEEIRKGCEDKDDTKAKDFKSVLLSRFRFNVPASLRKGEGNNSDAVFEEQKKKLKALKDRI